MNKWSIFYPDEDGSCISETLTEEQIVEQYFLYWSEQMTKIGKADLISRERCIEDWCTIHWAMKAVD